jgi:DNA repair protein RadC
MYFLLRETPKISFKHKAIAGPVDAASFAAQQLKGVAEADQELLIAIPLNTHHQPAAPIMIAAGGQSFAPADAKILFRRLLDVQAAAFILAHNHPSGDPTPSKEDIALTRKVAEAGELLDIHLIDHIVLGADSAYRSIRELVGL